MMMVFVANCVATVLVIYPSVAFATRTCVHLACIVVPYKAKWLVITSPLPSRGPHGGESSMWGMQNEKKWLKMGKNIFGSILGTP